MTHRPDPFPPKFALALLKWFCHPDYHYDIEGDLIEHFQNNVMSKGLRRAKLLFFIDVLLLFRPGTIRPLFKIKTQSNRIMYQHYLKVSWRQLARNKAYSFLSISGLAIGMAVVILLSLWVWDEMTYNKSHKNYDTIARTMLNQTFDGEIETWWSSPKQFAPELREVYGQNFKHVSSTSHFMDRIMFVDDVSYVRRGMFVESVFPEMLSIEMKEGSRDALTDPYSILISRETAEVLFKDKDPMDQTITLSSGEQLIVRGIFSDLPDNSSISGAKFFGSWELYEKWQPDWVGWGNSWFRTYVQLADNISFEQASQAIRHIKRDNIDKESAEVMKPEVFLHPMSKWHLYSKFENGVSVGGRIEYVRLYGTIGIFVLLLACINFINLSTARSEKRSREIGIRKTFGPFRGQLIQQFFVEALVITGLAFLVSISLVLILEPFYSDLTGKDIDGWWYSPVFWIIGVGTTVVTGTLASVYPAFYLSSFSPLVVLKGGALTGNSKNIPRKVLVVVQFTISIALIIGTLVVSKQIEFGKNRSLGYDQSNLFSSSISDKISDSYGSFRNELIQTGFIEEVGKSDNMISQTYVNNSGFDWEGKDPDTQEQFYTIRMSHEFGKTIGWEVLQGRDFSKEYTTDSMAFIINEAAAEYLGFDDPIGKKITWGDNGDYHIIGVVKNMITQSPYEPVNQMIYFIDYDRSDIVTMRIREGADIAAAIAETEKVFKRFDPDMPFGYRFMDDDYARKFRGEERIGKLAGFFTVLALFISCMGMVGMVAYVTERRTKEIGIRKVLGASVLSLWQLLTKEFVFLICVAGVFALPMAYYYMSGWLVNYEYRINITAWVLVLGLLSAVVITLVIISFQTIKSARSNPVLSLRSE